MEQDDHGELKRLLRENITLAQENNLLLKKLHRNALWTFWVRILWYVLLIGLPFVVYFFFLEPYFQAFGSSIEIFTNGMQEIPGWKQLFEGE